MHGDSNYTIHSSIFPPRRSGTAGYEPDPAKASVRRLTLPDEDGYLLLNTDGSIAEINEQAKKFLQNSSQNTLQYLNDLLPAVLVPEVDQLLDQLKPGTSARTKAYRIRDVSGTDCLLRITVQALNQNFIRKRAVLHFEEIDVVSELPVPDPATAICQAAAIATAVTDANGIIVCANEPFGKLIDLSTDLCIGQEIIQFVHPEEHTAFRIDHQQLEANHQFQAHFRISSGKKKTVHVQLHASKLPGDESGKILYQLVDISSAKAMEDQLRQKNADLQKINTELEQFVYSTSHDLRAPLRSVLGLLLIMQEETNPDTLRTYMEMIRTSVNKMDNFIKELIDLSRNSRQDIKREKIDFEGMISEIFENLQYIPGAENIDFSLDIQLAQDFYSDPSRLKVIISNLVSNAIIYHNYAQERPLIRVTFETKGKYGTLKVIDNGRGIKKEHQQRVFDMFYRASEDSKGSGLGLYIVKEAVNKLSGNVRIESTWGEGTTFSIQVLNLAPVK
jgi:PAS domain S-box-containing protein